MLKFKYFPSYQGSNAVGSFELGTFDATGTPDNKGTIWIESLVTQ